MSTARNKVARLQKEIADLRAKDAQEAKKEVGLNTKMVKASNDALTAKNPSTARSKANEANRAATDIASVQRKRADLAKSLASKLADLHRAQTALEKAEDTDRKRVAADQKKDHIARATQIKKLDQQLAAQRRSLTETPLQIASEQGDNVSGRLHTEYDVFICHASEDKDGFVRPFAEKLVAAGVRPFYDEMSTPSPRPRTSMPALATKGAAGFIADSSPTRRKSRCAAVAGIRARKANANDVR